MARHGMAPHLQPVLEPDAEGGDAGADQQHVLPRVPERRLQRDACPATAWLVLGVPFRGVRARVFSSGVHRLGDLPEQDKDYLLLFRRLGIARARLRGRRGAAPRRQAPPLPRRSEQVGRWQHSYGWGTAAKKSRIALDSDQISGEMMRKPSSSGTLARTGTASSYGGYPGRADAAGGAERRCRGGDGGDGGRQRCRSHACRVLSPLARAAPTISYPQAADKRRGRCRAARTHATPRTRRQSHEQNRARKYRARSSDLDKASSLRREPDATPCRERARFFCRPWPFLCPPPPRSSPRSGRPRPPARAAALLPHRPLRRRRRTPSRRGRRLLSRLLATGGSWC